MIIKRYRNNILKTIKTSLDLIKNKERNIIFLGFFDCLDESFIYINYWLKNILNDKTNSFMLFLEKSTLYKKENKDIINNIIKSFNENIQMHSLSKIKILDINYNKGNIDLENIFFEIANFLNDITELKNLNEDFKRIKNIYNINPQMKRIEYFEEIINDDYYKKFDKIYFKNNISKNSEINLPEKIYEKIHIILPKYDKKDFSNNIFFKKLIENSSQNKNLIDYIFYPNKPKVMSSTNIGSEIDINKIILYPFQPISEHIFYIENEITLIKDYSITIIIDNTMPCFSEFNESHSFLTIMNFLQIINLINIPSLDSNI